MKKILAISIIFLCVGLCNACELTIFVSYCLGSYTPVKGAEIKVYRSNAYDTTLYTDENGYGGLVYIPNNDYYDFYICYSSGRTYASGSVRRYQLASCYLPVYWCISSGRCTINIDQDEPEIKEAASLHQNYPNPFNPVTKIKFDIPHTGTGSAVYTTLKIYDILGKEVAVLVNKELLPGTYESEFDATSLPSSIYYYRLNSGDYTEIKKMVLIK